MNDKTFGTAWCSGNMAVSKTAAGSSILSVPVDWDKEDQLKDACEDV